MENNNPYRGNNEMEDDGFFDDLPDEAKKSEDTNNEETNEAIKENTETEHSKKGEKDEKEEKPPVSKNPYKMQTSRKDGGRYELKGNAPNKKTPKILLSILLGVLIFFAGGLSTWFSFDKETRSFLKVKFLIDNLYYGDSDTDFYETVFGAINTDYLDPYSQYYTADEYQDLLASFKGSRSGIGVSFLIEKGEEQDKLKVVLVCGNSPAEEAGVKLGSYLIGYGEAETDITPCKNFDAFASFLADYESGERIYLEFLEEEKKVILPIAKAEFIENYVFYRSSQTAYRFTGEKATTLTEGGNPLHFLNEDTAYIRLVQFTGAAGTQFDKAMKLFKEEKKKHLVLDLRNNGGGGMDVLSDIAKYFCKTSDSKNPLIATAIYKNSEEDFFANGNVYDNYFTDESQIYLLADNGTASASEALMGCMLDYEATSFENICLSERASASVVGGREAKTYGKGIMQMTLPLLFGKDAFKLTVAKIVWPISGNCIHARGILPIDGTKTIKENNSDDLEISDALSCWFPKTGTGKIINK